MLSHAKSPSACDAIFKAHCYTKDSHLSVISTYIHGKAQTPLDLFSTYYTSKFATNTQEIEAVEL